MVWKCPSWWSAHTKKENSLQRVRFRFLITDGLAFHDSTMPNEDPIQFNF